MRITDLSDEDLLALARQPEPLPPGRSLDERALKLWLSERWVEDRRPNGGAGATALHRDYVRWCKGAKYTALNLNTFGKALRALAVPFTRQRGCATYHLRRKDLVEAELGSEARSDGT